MSIKRLFEKGKTDKVITTTDLQTLREDIESAKNMEQRFGDVNRFSPQVDFANPEKFARFGSAEKYYTDSIDRILSYFPYDGAEAEVNEFFNNSNYIDDYIYENLYPRTTGYITFSPHDATDDDGGWGGNDTQPAAATLYYGEPSGKEYIEVKGGPHSGSYGMPSGSLGTSFTGSNYYSTDIYNQAKASPYGRDGTRASNLRMNLDDGITVEFWLKKESFIPSKTQKEVVFDLWNQVTSSSPQHGRLMVELTASGYAEDGADPFRFTFVSGAVATGAGSGFQNLALGGTSITTASVADNKWHHYALSVVNGPANKTVVRFYRDGQLVNTVSTGSVAEEVTGSLIGFIGALQTHPNLPVGTTIPADGMTGWGKLSGSVDEFRYWKTRRSGEEINRNYFTHVRGGSNTDVSNAELGVYYKFNEGITTDSSLDATVLDYSGRLSNGIWVGYASDARSTGSAIVESSGSNKTEYKDPIMYHTHPDVQTLKNNLAASASYYDIRNNTSLYHSMPSWIIEDDTESGQVLKNLSQIMGNYFDTLYLQIEAATHIQSPTYNTSSGKPLPFSNRLLEAKGFVTSDIFANADIIEAIKNRDGERDFASDMHEVKSLIYKNIYNNLVDIYKSKGTEKSFRNLIRCFGVDEELIRINMYADNVTQLLRDNYRAKTVKKNFANFYHPDNYDAVVTHQTSSQAGGANNSDSIGVTYISASHKDISTTGESEVIFPRLKRPGDPGYFETSFTDSSIFGWDQADADPDDYIKPTDGSGYQVLAIRPDTNSKDAYFKLVDRSNDATIATSSLYKDVYDDQRWTFALRTRNVMTSSITPTDPATSHGMGTFLTGAAGIRAKATITVIDSSSPPGVPFIGEGDTIVLISTDGTTVTLTMQGTGGSTTSSETSGATLTAKTLSAGSYASSTLHATAQAVEIRTAINHHTKFSATNAANVISIVQAEPGTSGNTTLTITEIGATGMSNTNFAGGANANRVEVSLYGVHAVHDRIQEEFALSGNAIHSDITVPRRYYVGARRTNVTGAVNEKSSVRVGYLRHWQSYLKNEVIRAHARDTENYGARNPYKSTYLLETPLTGVWLPEIETLSLNWDFSNVTGSDSDGEFILQDFSSGSLLKRRYRDPDIDPIVNNQYNARGYFFKTNTTAAVDANYISSARHQLPEVMNSQNMIEIRSEDDLTFTRENRPIDYFFAFEKSMYQTISEEMLNMFAGIVEFNNLIGEPANRYRFEYKDMSKLRQLFFENVENTPDLDKYLSYYKWLDTALGHMLQQLVPGSSRFSDDIRNIIEDTTLDRNKYRHILPTLKTPDLQIEGQIKGIEEHLYNWKIGHAPMNNKGTKVVHPQPENQHCLWWKHRAERMGVSVTSDKAPVNRSAAQVAIIDEQRDTYKRTGYSFISASVPQFTALQGTDGVTKVGINNVPIYTGSYYPNNRFSRVYRLFMGVGFNSRSIIGAWDGYLTPGHNSVYGPNAKYTYWRKATNPADATRLIEITNLIDQTGCEDTEKLPAPGSFPSKKLGFGGVVPISATSTALSVGKASDTPFSLYKSDATTGYKSSISNVNIKLKTGITTAGGLEINNLHQDVIETGEVSMQGPFTEKYVGGLPHRHVDLNTSKGGALDAPTNRVEGFVIVPAADSIQVRAPSAASDDRGSSSPEVRGEHYRNVKTKRPVNLRNIRQLTGSNQLNQIGNFASFREVVQISDRSVNNRAFVKHEGKGPFHENNSQTKRLRGSDANNPGNKLGEFKDVAKPSFYISGSSHRENDIISLGSNQFAESNRTDYIIIERFSAPGGPETAGDSMGGAALDFGSAQYSPYNNINYRNLSVRLSLRRMLTDHANQFGLKSDASTADQNAAGAAHDAYNPSTVSSHDYSGVPAFHDVNRNSRLRYEFSSSRQTAETVIRKQTHDNYYVQREIPQSDTQYAWITASLTHIPGHQTTVLDHPHPDGMVSSSVAFNYGLAQGAAAGIASTTKTVGPGFIPAYNFVSASDYVTKVQGSANRRWYVRPDQADKRVAKAGYEVGFLPTDFVGMNGNIIQRFNTSSFTLSGSNSSHHNGLTQIGTAPFYRAVDIYGNTLVGSTTGELLFGAAGQANGGDVPILNSLNLNRNGPYGYPSWKQIRTGETRLGRYLRRNNIISYNEIPGRHLLTEDKGRGRIEKVERFGSLRQFREPAVVSKYKPVTFKLGMKTEIDRDGKSINVTRPLNFDASYGNEQNFFSNIELDAIKGFVKGKPIGYKAISDFYLRGGLQDASTPVESFIEFKYSETVFPRSENTYLGKIRRRNSFSSSFWNDSEIERRVLGQSRDGFDGLAPNSSIPSTGGSITGPNSKKSAWVLDGLLQSTITTGSVNRITVLTGSETGDLQNMDSILHHGAPTTLTASYIYARPHLISTTASLNSLTGPAIPETGSTSLIGNGYPLGRIKMYGGITSWEAGEQAGSINNDGIFVSSSTAPFYNGYEDYSEDLRAIAKDYSIVPEFRISEHIEYYVKNKQGDFLAENPRLLSIFGSPSGSSVPQNSSENEFFKVYSNSDFLKHFNTVKRDHAEVANTSELTLTCKAAMKFLPYDGFYPAQRTAEIATQFSRSYGAFISGSATNAAGAETNIPAAQRMRPVIAPLFAPGILFNTIKSGIAVDYPVYTGSFQRIRPLDTGHSNHTSDYYMIGKAARAREDSKGKLAGWDIRVPFEALVEPEKHISNVNFVDMEVHPSAALNVTSSWTGFGDDLYKMMTNNFLAEVPEFFLPSGEFATLKSKPQKQFLPLETGSVYGLRIKIRKSYNKARQQAVNRAPAHQPYYVPQDVYSDSEKFKNANNQRNNHLPLKETFTMYSRPSAFGPPVSGRNAAMAGGTHATGDDYKYALTADSLTGINPAFTPPYYDGESWCDVVFRPSSSYVTLGDILADSQKLYWRFDKTMGAHITKNNAQGDNTKPYGMLNINNFSMQLSSSFNLFGKALEPVVKFDKDGNPVEVGASTDENSVWVMQPKFETPMYNFADSGVHAIKDSVNTLQIPVHNSESVSRGMWHQFGVIPTDPSRGIFLEITDIPNNFLKERVPLFISGAVGTNDSSNSFNYEFDDTKFRGIYNNGQVRPLLDIVKFDQKIVKLGQTADKKIVSEAIVAVPFMEEAGKRKFFKLDKQLVDEYMKNPETDKVGESIKHMLTAMQKYVIPPTMDFVTFRDRVDPIAMYLFEFNYELSQDDLSHIWQNLMPPSARTVQVAETKVNHKLLLNEIFGNAAKETGQSINDNLKWMVFKVKQKANKNYFSKVVTANQDADPRYRSSFKAGRSGEDVDKLGDMSYNWPYDFFSFVEMVKLDAEVKISPVDKDVDSKLVINTDAEEVDRGVKANPNIEEAGPKLPPRK